MKKKEGTPQTYSAGLVEDSFASALLQYFPLQIGPNASACDPRTILDLLLDATLHNRTVTASLNILNQSETALPDSDSVFHHLKKLTIEGVQQWYDIVNRWTIAQLRARDTPRSPMLVAIDEHRRPYYGKEDKLTTRGQHKNGTNKAHAVMSAELLGTDNRPTLATVALPPLKANHDSLEKLLKKAESTRITIRGYLMDRGLFGIDNIQVLERHDQRYLIGRPATKQISRLWQQHSRSAVCVRNSIHETEELVVIHDHQIGTPKRHVITTLIIAKRTTDRDTDLHAWVTDFPCTTQSAKTLLDTYRSRWGIETGYRCKKEARAKTTATNPALRLALILLSFLLYNLWRLTQWVTRPRDPRSPDPPLYYYLFRHAAHSRLCRLLLGPAASR